MTWVLLLVNALFLAWVVKVALPGNACEDELICVVNDVGTLAILGLMWLFAVLIIGGVWLLTLPRQRRPR